MRFHAVLSNGTSVKWVKNTCTLSPAGCPLGPSPVASGLVWCGSASAASGAWGTPAVREPEGSLNCLEWGRLAQQMSEVVQGMDVHWQQGWGVSEHWLDFHYSDLETKDQYVSQLVYCRYIGFSAYFGQELMENAESCQYRHFRSIRKRHGHMVFMPQSAVIFFLFSISHRNKLWQWQKKCKSLNSMHALRDMQHLFQYIFSNTTQQFVWVNTT